MSATSASFKPGDMAIVTRDGHKWKGREVAVTACDAFVHCVLFTDLARALLSKASSRRKLESCKFFLVNDLRLTSS